MAETTTLTVKTPVAEKFRERKDDDQTTTELLSQLLGNCDSGSDTNTDYVTQGDLDDLRAELLQEIPERMTRELQRSNHH